MKTKRRWKASKPMFKKAFVQGTKPRELIVPSAKQEQMWAEGLYSFITGKRKQK